MPRVFAQTDFSNGGDGIVVRQAIKTVADLRGKTCVLAQNSPSHFFLLNALINGGVQPSEVTMKFTGDAFQAAAAFNADKKIDCVVTWSPDIYNLEKIPGNRMLVNTGTANKLIADVWMVRADFAKDNLPIIEGLVRGTFDAIDSLKTEAGKAKAAAKRPITSAAGLDAAAERRLQRLREWRAGVAKEHGVPAYVVFHDATLAELARSRPQSEEALGQISGIGARKLERYGATLLTLLRN
jgi:ABC-type nitrate/sulfonate/bicarbonate transport system substrate-binding protein